MNEWKKGYAGQAPGNSGSGTFYPEYKTRRSFTPKKPVRTFRDLEVYQKTLECSVLIVKDIRPALVKLKYDFLENMTNCSMSIPLYIGEAHSMRFASLSQGVLLLEKAMACCNKMVIYLEQAKGLYGEKMNTDLVEDI